MVNKRTKKRNNCSTFATDGIGAKYLEQFKQVKSIWDKFTNQHSCIKSPTPNVLQAVNKSSEQIVSTIPPTEPVTKQSTTPSTVSVTEQSVSTTPSIVTEQSVSTASSTASVTKQSVSTTVSTESVITDQSVSAITPTISVSEQTVSCNVPVNRKRVRRKRCGECTGCCEKNHCGECKFCSKPQLKKPCVKRQCVLLQKVKKKQL